MTKDEITIQSAGDVRLQKSRFSLLCSGNALITFTAWIVVRSIIQFYFRTGTMEELGLLMSVIVPVIVFGAIDVVLKFIVGLSARAEARGKRKRGAYIVLGIILAAFTVFELISMLLSYSFYYETEGLLGMIVTMAVEATVLFAEVDLVVSAINVRKTEKEIAEKNAQKGGER